MIETANVRAAFARRTRPNTFFHYRSLVTPTSQTVTTPNVDTLYSTSWLDLSAGPLTIDVPSFGDRYLSVAVMDTYSNNFALLGSRTSGSSPVRFSISGPDRTAAGAVSSPTRWAWLLIRAEVDQREDLGDFHALQDQCRIAGPTGSAAFAPGCRADGDPVVVLETLTRLLAESPPSSAPDEVMRAIAALGLAGEGRGRPWSADELRTIHDGFMEARTQLLRTPPGLRQCGWILPFENMGAFGPDYRSRALIALKGLGALPNREAMYFWALAPDGQTEFDADQRWRLTLPSGSLPVDAFWSLTAYRRTPSGQSYLFDNALGRHALGSHQDNLQRADDGSITVFLQRHPPADGPIANWLPTPPEGAFELVLRAYLPRRELLDRSFRLPSVVPAS
ncbi:DUF1254 domain-containing protein [Tsuneonella dongtanensis]|uniref:DUF1254 domain-containing protein n=1 Tax=Tsuneonella dongtanensis TaxID=692370 RepID=UPI0018DBD41A|nr:DUF1254 domain-containing protein [Tsuneonella dongtanensis]